MKMTVSKLTYSSSFRAGYNKASNDILQILTDGNITIDNLEKGINFIRKKLDKTDIPNDIKCSYCDSLLNPEGKIKDGVYQFGQDDNGIIRSFCDKKHLDKYESSRSHGSGNEVKK